MSGTKAVVGDRPAGHRMAKDGGLEGCEKREVGPRRGDELFPLRLVSQTEFFGEALKGSRSEHRTLHDINDVLRGLNWLAGFHDVPDQRGLQDLTSKGRALQNSVRTRVQTCVASYGHGDDETPKEAFTKLLRGRGAYGPEAAYATLATFKNSSVSLPEDVGTAPLLLELLGHDERVQLEGFEEHMLRSAEERQHIQREHPIRVYNDRRLIGSRRTYGRFVRRLAALGLVTFTLSPQEEVGVFFVWRKGRERMRMILDCRRANQAFVEPPGINLLTAEGLANIELPSDGEEPVSIFLGAGDIKDCFHRYRLSESISRWFCYPKGTAKEFGLTGSLLGGRQLRDEDLVWPAAAALPMGWSWSGHFAEAAGLEQLRSVPRLSSSALVTDRAGPIVLSGKAEDLWHYLYLDNLGVIGHDRDVVEEALAESVSTFESRGLLMHDVEVSSGTLQTLGCELDGISKTTRLTRTRFWRVRRGVRYALALRGGLTGVELEVLIGHCTFCGLLARESLSIWHAAYKFIEKNYHRRAELWHSVREELRAFVRLCPLLQSEWRRDWSGLVNCTDASEFGWGVTTRYVPPEEASKIGRRSERERFRLLPGCSGRERALQAAGLGGREPASGIRFFDADRWAEVPFDEVPASLLVQADWQLSAHGAWKRVEDILVLESRAVVLGAARFGRAKPSEGKHVLFLGDNMSAILCFSRYRAREHRVLIHVRRLAAIALSRGIKFHFRWVPSELNSADEGSRLCDPSYVPEGPRVYRNTSVDLFTQSRGGVTGSSKAVSCDPGRGDEVHHRGDVTVEKENSLSPGDELGSERRAHSREPRSFEVSGVDHGPCQPFSRDERGERSGLSRLGQQHEGGDREDGRDDGGSEYWSAKSEEDQDPAHGEASGADLVGAAAGPNGAADERRHVGTREGRRSEWYPAGNRHRRGRRPGERWHHHGRRGKRNCGDTPSAGREATTSTGAPAPQELPAPERGRDGLGEHAGVYGCHPGDVPDVSGGAGLLPGYRREGEVELGDGRGHRWASGGPYEQLVLYGPPGLERGEAAGWVRPLLPGVWSPGEALYRPGLESPQGLAETHAWPLSQASGFGDLVRYSRFLGGAGEGADGGRDHAGSVSLLEAFGTSQVDRRVAGRTVLCLSALVPVVAPVGRVSAVKDEDSRRQHHLGLGLHRLDVPGVRGAEEGAPSAAALLLRLPQPAGGHQAGHGLLEVRGHCAVPVAAQRALDRPGAQASVSRRSSEARQVAEQQVGCPLREGSPVGRDVERVGRGDEGEVHVLRAPLRRARVRRPDVRQGHRPVIAEARLVLDLFSGKGKVANACRRRGFQSMCFDIINHPSDDLTGRVAYRRIRHLVTSGKVAGAILAVPCTSFSLARNRTSVIRTKRFPWGVRRELNERERAALDLGNSLARAALKYVRLFNRHRLPWIIENPRGSILWHLPELHEVACQANAHFRIADFCRYGARWRKRTGFLCGNLELDDTVELSHTCPTGRWCSATGREHIVLSGNNEHGIPWTKVAEPYPSKLASVLAKVLTNNEFALATYNKRSK